MLRLPSHREKSLGMRLGRKVATTTQMWPPSKSCHSHSFDTIVTVTSQQPAVTTLSRVKKKQNNTNLASYPGFPSLLLSQPWKKQNVSTTAKKAAREGTRTITTHARSLQLFQFLTHMPQYYHDFQKSTTQSKMPHHFQEQCLTNHPI